MPLPEPMLTQIQFGQDPWAVSFNFFDSPTNVQQTVDCRLDALFSNITRWNPRFAQPGLDRSSYWTNAVYIMLWPLPRHYGRDGVSNHQPHHCLLNRLSSADQRKHQGSASLAFVRGIHRWPVNSPHKWPVTRKMLPFDDVIMNIPSRFPDWHWPWFCPFDCSLSQRLPARPSWHASTLIQRIQGHRNGMVEARYWLA